MIYIRHKHTEGRAPVCGSEFTTEAATLQGGEAEFVLSLRVLGLGKVFARARVVAHEVFRAVVLAERRLRVTASITPGSRSKGTVRGTYLLPKAPW